MVKKTMHNIIFSIISAITIIIIILALISAYYAKGFLFMHTYIILTLMYSLVIILIIYDRKTGKNKKSKL
ncbi:hypothetical protein [Acidiplasma aeolicum]|jgi:membrane protease YdiL (CAAX protease family)|uniref:hypothetical protein n=1 Tax=Acidiplasma aeolicum TaxID=507754 RepID=UPI00371D97E8